MEFHAMHGERYDHLLTIHRREGEKGPLQMVSAGYLAYLQQVEMDYTKLLEKLAAAEPPIKA